ncbi:hypothetical protein JOB18_048687 [Solea senegalensis]|uniref:Secreted protein n=1 Tax=Solea senegalensis TaxID=28829 RepID=A0AAV6Q1G8_SOLSE|nr:hypothetical protein JOB18_048687 [Solea senegalensis]
MCLICVAGVAIYSSVTIRWAAVPPNHSGRLPHKGGRKAPVSPLVAGGWVASLLCFLHFRVRVVTGPLGCCCWLRAVHRSVPLTACRWSLSGSVDPPVPRCVGRDRLIGAEPTVVDWCPGHGVPFLLC